MLSFYENTKISVSNKNNMIYTFVWKVILGKRVSSKGTSLTRTINQMEAPSVADFPLKDHAFDATYIEDVPNVSENFTELCSCAATSSASI